MHHNNLALDSIALINEIVASNNFSNLSDLDKEKFIANRAHLILSLNNTTQDELDNETIEKVQQCLNSVKNYDQS